MLVTSITPCRGSCLEVYFFVPSVICGGLTGNLKGTHMTWGLNFAFDNATNAVNMAQSIFRAFSPASEATKNGVVLDFIELGMYFLSHSSPPL